jgi:hypothetical protein
MMLQGYNCAARHTQGRIAGDRLTHREDKIQTAGSTPFHAFAKNRQPPSDFA